MPQPNYQPLSYLMLNHEYCSNGRCSNVGCPYFGSFLSIQFSSCFGEAAHETNQRILIQGSLFIISKESDRHNISPILSQQKQHRLIDKIKKLPEPVVYIIIMG